MWLILVAVHEAADEDVGRIRVSHLLQHRDHRCDEISCFWQATESTAGSCNVLWLHAQGNNKRNIQISGSWAGKDILLHWYRVSPPTHVPPAMCIPSPTATFCLEIIGVERHDLAVIGSQVLRLEKRKEQKRGVCKDRGGYWRCTDIKVLQQPECGGNDAPVSAGV